MARKIGNCDKSFFENDILMYDFSVEGVSEEDIEKLLEAKAYVNFLKMILEYENNTLQWAIL